MNARLLGTLCIIGAAISMVVWVSRAILGLDGEDKIASAGYLWWAVGGLCGVMGLIVLKATGTHPVLRLLSFVPAIGFLWIGVGEILFIAGATPTHDSLG